MGASKSGQLPSWHDYQGLFGTLADPLFVLEVGDAHSIRIVAANPACESFFAVPAADCIDRPLESVLASSAAHAFVAACDRCKSHQSDEFQLELGGKVRRAFGIKLRRVSDGDGSCFISALAQVANGAPTLEPGLRAEHFRVVAEHAADYISRCDPEGRILYLNPAIERLIGASSASLIGRDVSQWEADLPHVDLYRDCVRRVVATGEPQTIEMDFPNPSSQRRIFHQIRYAPELGPDGEVLSVIGVGRDITALKSAEADLRELNVTLEERVVARTLDLERANSDLRSFAWTVSHDLRAPLRAIYSRLVRLTEDEGERLSHDGRTVLHRVVGAATKLDGLISAILAYSQAGQKVLTGQRVLMGDIVREVAAELAQPPARARIDVAELPAAHADVTMVRQIFQNLIGNALKFSAGREHPRVEVGWREQDGEVIYYVRDNGAGFDMQYAGKLYSMFERLHDVDEFPGSGVGLAIVKRLVERHGGRIWAESRAEHGATFYFTLAAKARPRSGFPATPSI